MTIIKRHAAAIYKTNSGKCAHCDELIMAEAPYVLNSGLRIVDDEGTRTMVRLPRNLHLKCAEEMLGRSLEEYDFDPHVNRNWWVWEPSRTIKMAEGLEWVHVPELNVYHAGRNETMPPESYWLHLTPNGLHSLKRSGRYWMLHFWPRKIEGQVGPAHLTVGVALIDAPAHVAIAAASKIMSQFIPA